MRVRHGVIGAAVALALAAAPAAALAAVDAFIWFDKIAGESKAADHAGWTEVSSVAFGASRPAAIGSATGGAGAGKATVHEFTIVKTVDKASPAFLRAQSTGAHFGVVKLEMRKAGGDPHSYLSYTFRDVMITAIHTAGGGAAPMESISFSFADVQQAGGAQPTVTFPPDRVQPGGR